MRGHGTRRAGQRQNAEHDPAQPIGRQPQAGNEDDPLEKPERTPSFLSARELQARDSAKGGTRDGAEERTEKPRSKKG
jgi:hypothetical protein